MSIKISLDTNALRELFPEGSEARIQLQSACISNIVKGLYPNMLRAEVREQVKKTLNTELDIDEKSIRKWTKEATDELFEKQWGIHPKALKGDAEEIVKRSVHGQFNRMVTELIGNAADNYMTETGTSELDERIASRLKATIKRMEFSTLNNKLISIFEEVDKLIEEGKNV